MSESDTPEATLQTVPIDAGTMTIASNTKTLLHGNLFTGTRSFLSLSTAWNSDIDEGF